MTALRRRLRADVPLSARLAPVTVVGLALGYVVLLVVRLPHLYSELNTDGDVSTAWLMATVAGTGHTGELVTSAQGGWVSLGFGVLTRGLPLHRQLWTVAPLMLSLGWTTVVAITVTRLAGRGAGLLAAAIILCASPTERVLLIAPWYHNTTFAAVAVLGALLVWLGRTARSRPVVFAVGGVTGLLLGPLLASDGLLLVAGVLPFALTVVVLALRRGARVLIPPAVGLIAGAGIGDAVSGAVVRHLGFATAPSPLRFSLSLVPRRVEWAATGLLRLGGGLPVDHVSLLRAALLALAGAATLAGLAVTLGMGWRAATRPGDTGGLARSAHLIFWAATVACSLIAYLLTTGVATDRYLGVAVPAVAATVPLLVGEPHRRRLVLLGAGAYLAAALVALGAGDTTIANRPALRPAQAGRLAAFVRAHGLGIGFSGYWEAAPLDWASGMHLHVYPITDVGGPGLRPSWNGWVASWYHPRRTPSYLLLEPGDPTLSNRQPASLPPPSRMYHVGAATIAAYRFDIAADFRR